MLNTEQTPNHGQSEFCFLSYNMKSTVESYFAETGIITH